MWGSDFPHIRSMSVNAQSETAKMLETLPADAQTKIVADNAAEVYRLN